MKRIKWTKRTVSLCGPHGQLWKFRIRFCPHKVPHPDDVPAFCPKTHLSHLPPMSTTPEPPEIELKRNQDKITHGHTIGRKSSPTYHSWLSMRARCSLSQRESSPKYKDRGITVADRWNDFEAFLADMGERPKGTTLEREDNNGNYEPGNCRWATPIEQARNTRRTKLTFDSARQVAILMLNGGSPKLIAAQFGLSESLPREIMRGACWKDALAAAKAIKEAE